MEQLIPQVLYYPQVVKFLTKEIVQTVKKRTRPAGMEVSIPHLPQLTLAVFQGNASNSPSIFSTKSSPTFVTKMPFWNGFFIDSFLNMLGSNGSPNFWEKSTIQKINNKSPLEISLVAQWLRIRLPMQGTQVRALVQEDSTCRGATKPVCHNYWACALEPASHNYWARVPQLLKPARLKPMICNKRSHRNEKLAHCNEE